MINIRFYDNYIIYSDRIIAILELIPIDIYLESEAEQGIFYENIQRTINLIRDFEIQFLIKVTNMKTENLKDHFVILRKYSKDKEKDTEELRNILVEKYINNLTKVLSENFIPRRSVYFCISVPLGIGFKGEGQVKQAGIVLDQKIERIRGMFSKCQIELNSLDNIQIKELLKEFLRK
ncbi:MAG: hypothetical protein WCO33_05175 [bacterium]